VSAAVRVVKVGGSLYDLPDLGPRLQAWLGPERTLLLPGGGATADAIRAFDRTHRLGEEASHWLALHALSVNAHFLGRLLPSATVRPCLPRPTEGGPWFILDPLPFFQDDERHPDRFPHTWDVTSDSLAVRVAIRTTARELVLLKSVSWDEADGWEAAARAGVVDGYFAQALRGAPHRHVRVVNFRDTHNGRVSPTR
jgi:aspartokinase-like uncharacterized kinase